MAQALTISDLVARNRDYAQSHKPIPQLSELSTKGIPVWKVLVLTCCDPRNVPEQFFGVKPGEFPMVAVRNVCGHAELQMPHLLALDVLLGLEGIMVIHHSGECKRRKRGFRAQTNDA